MSNSEALYDLQFKVIPKLCTLYEDAINIFDNFNDNKVIDKEFMKNNFEIGYIDWDDLIFQKKELPNNVIEYIYDFGEPPRFPLCRFAIFYVDKTKKIYEYFTLEKTLIVRKYPYLICGQKGNQHKNYMTESPGIFNIFENMVKTIIDDGIKPIQGTKIM